MKTIVKNILAVCNTCKDVEKQYTVLLNSGIDKDSAKQAIKEAKQAIKDNSEKMKTERKDVVKWFNAPDNIAVSLFHSFIKDYSGTKTAKTAYTYKDNIKDFISKYYSVVVVVENVATPATKVTHKDENNNTIVDGYKPINVTANNIRVILRKCFDNVVKSNFGAFIQSDKTDNIIIK